MRWREHIHPNHLQEIHLPEDGQQCLWKLGCSNVWTPLFCSLRCTIRIELYHFLHMFHKWMTLTYKQCHHAVSFSGDVVMNRLLSVTRTCDILKLENMYEDGCYVERYF
jgi:hypothetical protein